MPTISSPIHTRGLSVNSTQRQTLIYALIFFLILLFLTLLRLLRSKPAPLRYLSYIASILWPLNMLVISFHEFSHALACLLTGGSVVSISLNHHEGGATVSKGGSSGVILSAGYLGSSFIGALLVFAGFNIVASKVASIVIGVTFLMTLWWGKRNPLTIFIVLLGAGLIVACWFIDHAVALRYVVLFIGVQSCFYSVWDIIDDCVTRTVAESDASQFAENSVFGARTWGVFWSLIAMLFAAGGIVAGIAAFDETAAEQEKASDSFLPTLVKMAVESI